MLAFQTISLVVLFTILHICLSYPSIKDQEFKRLVCRGYRGCGSECDKCIYGVVTSLVCEVQECRKGPNKDCGGFDNIRGVCGDGLRCQCRKCAGCSLDTYKCAELNPDETCRPIFDMLVTNRFTSQ